VAVIVPEPLRTVNRGRLNLTGALTTIAGTLKIDALDIYWVKLPLAFNFRTSYGDQLYTETMLVRMESEGQYAWGESCPPYVPSYSAEHTTGTFHTLRALMAPRIIGQEIASAQDLLDRLAFIKGNQFARAALEITWWVLDAKRRGLPLHRALGVPADRVAVGADFGVQDSLDMLMEKIQGAVDAGFPRNQVEVPARLGSEHVEAVRSTFPDFTFHIDCNAAYTPRIPSSFASSIVTGSP